MSTVASVSEFSFYLSSEIDLPVRPWSPSPCPMIAVLLPSPLHAVPAWATACVAVCRSRSGWTRSWATSTLSRPAPTAGKHRRPQMALHTPPTPPRSMWRPSSVPTARRWGCRAARAGRRPWTAPAPGRTGSLFPSRWFLALFCRAACMQGMAWHCISSHGMALHSIARHTMHEHDTECRRGTCASCNPDRAGTIVLTKLDGPVMNAFLPPPAGMLIVATEPPANCCPAVPGPAAQRAAGDHGVGPRPGDAAAAAGGHHAAPVLQARPPQNRPPDGAPVAGDDGGHRRRQQHARKAEGG